MKAFSLIPILPFNYPIASKGWSHQVCRGSALALGLRENKKNNISNRKLFSTAQRQLHQQQQQHPYKSYTMPQGLADRGTGGSPATAYIALGSNLGDRIGWIEKACKEMDARGIRVKRTSSLWETKPMYVLDQDSFVNGACEVETTLEPLALLDALQSIENSLGRKKIIDKGPRNIDLDILMYEDRKINHERLIVPHIGIPEREFVLRPLAELAANKPLDINKPWKLIQDYLNELAPSDPPLTTLTPLASSNLGPLRALSPDRKTHVMAILNMTPDSFSDGGVHANDSAAALTSTVRFFIGHGATMIDVGGQSTAPKTPEVSVEEELSRVIPAIQHIRSLPEAKDVLISIDTYRAVVARAAIEAGADLVNDISAGTMDPAMLTTVAELGATVCLMHMRGTPQTMNQHAVYPPTPDLGPSEPAFRFPSSAESEALIGSIAAELLSRVAAAEAAGIRRWRIVLDPGLGFAKIGPQNVDVLRHLDVLRDWPGLRGLPWLVGSSRKSFIGQVTGVPTPKERIWGTAATVSAAVQGGADIVRVHDVKEMAQVVLMSDSIWRY